jgi:hypothetical protein
MAPLRRSVQTESGWGYGAAPSPEAEPLHRQNSSAFAGTPANRTCDTIGQVRNPPFEGYPLPFHRRCQPCTGLWTGNGKRETRAQPPIRPFPERNRPSMPRPVGHGELGLAREGLARYGRRSSAHGALRSRFFPSKSARCQRRTELLGPRRVTWDGRLPGRGSVPCRRRKPPVESWPTAAARSGRGRAVRPARAFRHDGARLP